MDGLTVVEEEDIMFFAKKSYVFEYLCANPECFFPFSVRLISHNNISYNHSHNLPYKKNNTPLVLKMLSVRNSTIHHLMAQYRQTDRSFLHEGFLLLLDFFVCLWIDFFEPTLRLLTL